MADLWQDLKFGWRMLAKNPPLSLIAIASLALAIGANTAIFTVWSAVMLHGVAVHDPATLVNLYTQDEGTATLAGNTYLGLSVPNYQDYARDSRVFSALGFYTGAAAALNYQGQTDQVNAELVSGNYFQMLGVAAARGRVFTAAETATDGQGALLVLSDDFWHSRFGGDPAILGQMVTLNHHAFMIAGVAPPSFHGTLTLQGPDLWAPASMHAALITGPFAAYYTQRRPRIVSAVGRLLPGVSLRQAQAAVRLTAQQLALQYPVDNRAQTAVLVPLLQSTISPNARGQFVLAFAMMMAVVGLVLLIACANVANLLLARGMSRHREIAVRLALGASRRRLIRQLLVESVLLALLAGGLGLLLARAARDWLWAHRPPQLLRSPLHLALDPRVLLFALGLSLLTGLLFGLAPALQSTRLDLITQLKERTQPARGSHRPWSLRGLLLIGEVAFSLVALIVAGLFLASLRNLQQTSPGFDAAHLASLNFDLGTIGFDLARPGTPLAVDQFEQQVLDRARALPGVTQATLAAGTPMAAGNFARSFTLQGEVPRPGQGARFAVVESILPGSYFATMGIPLLQGRDFSPGDSASSQKVVIVNQTMARQLWPGQDALGKRLKFFGETDYSQVVGIAQDIKYFSLSENPTVFAYLPLAQYPATALGLTVRTAGNPSGVLPEMRQLMHAQAPNLAVTRLEAAETPIHQSLFIAQLGASLLGLLASLATLLAAIGIYGVMAYSVRQRARELGIRIALGASAGHVFRLVLAGGMLLVAIGILLGLGGAWALGRAVAALLYGLPGADPATFTAYSLLFLAIALFASFLPARRATRVDPVVTLRNE
ncbi:MAG TPA: ABC transporter permease [Terriglobales bacterium]|nr:ABC transporter permease [Terriglobales bacterium]